MNNYVVYLHTSPSGKRYVGITCTAVEKRWRHGNGYYKNKYFARAIKKYGWENFTHEIVAEGLSKVEAEEIEQSLIMRYQSSVKLYGYNIKSGGDSNGRHAEESKQLMSENRKGKGTQPRSEATKQKMRENHKGGARSKAVLCVETNTIYESINDAARDVNINKKVISNCCRGIEHYNTAAGYHWRFV